MGPERRYINSVHRQVDSEWRLWKECMTGKMGGSGTPDYYYEYLKGSTWIEYKAVPNNLPAIIEVWNPAKQYGLSPLQRRWVNRAADNGQRVAVVLGSMKEGGIIFTNKTWEESWDKEAIEHRRCIIDPYRVAQFAAGFNDYWIVK